MKIITTIALVLLLINISGADWIVLNSPTQNTLWSVCFSDTSNGWAVGENGTIIHSTDGGITWEFQAGGTNEILYGVFFIDSNNGWVVGDNGIILHTSNAGQNWEAQSGIVNNRLWKVFFINSNLGWAVGSSIIHTTDGGVNWTQQTVNPFSQPLYGLSFVDENNGWAAGGTNDAQFIIHTTNGGNNWIVQSDEPGSWLYSVCFVDGNNGWISGQYGTILNTTDGGNTWLSQNSGLNSGLEAIFFTDNNNGWTVGPTETVLNTTDAGSTWNTQTSNTNNALYALYFTDVNHGWAVGYNGVIVRTPYVVPVELTSFSGSINPSGKVLLNWTTATEINNKGFEIQRSIVKKSGLNWENIGFVGGNGTSTIPHSYSYSDYSVLRGNYYYRLKQIDFDGSYEYSKEVAVEITASLKFSLEQNYPNPFNPGTKIIYSVPQASEVQIKVFDVLGDEIETLVSDEKLAGTYILTWNAANLPNGIYFYRIQAGSFTETRKMILLK